MLLPSAFTTSVFVVSDRIQMAVWNTRADLVRASHMANSKGIFKGALHPGHCKQVMVYAFVVLAVHLKFLCRRATNVTEVKSKSLWRGATWRSFRQSLLRFIHAAALVAHLPQVNVQWMDGKSKPWKSSWSLFHFLICSHLPANVDCWVVRFGKLQNPATLSPHTHQRDVGKKGDFNTVWQLNRQFNKCFFYSILRSL